MFQVKERFKLSENFLEEFHGKQPQWGPLGYVTFKRTYARVIRDEDGTERTEEYWETPSASSKAAIQSNSTIARTSNSPGYLTRPKSPHRKCSDSCGTSSSFPRDAASG